MFIDINAYIHWKFILLMADGNMYVYLCCLYDMIWGKQDEKYVPTYFVINVFWFRTMTYVLSWNNIEYIFSIQHDLDFFLAEDHDPTDRNCAFCRKCCIGCCYRIWLKFQDCLLLLVHDMLFDTTVTLCIILNTAFLAVEHHGMSEDLKHVLDIGNKVYSFYLYFIITIKHFNHSEIVILKDDAKLSLLYFQVFTTFFTAEAVLKLLACSKVYFESGWNIFDLIIVIASLVDLSVENINGISVLRGMRLVRNRCLIILHQVYKHKLV